MFRNDAKKYTTKLVSSGCLVAMLGAILEVVTNLIQPLALSAAANQVGYPTATPGEPIAVLTIILRDSIGNPLEGVRCDVLSYGWGLQINEAFAVIARGETDRNGVVAFDDSRWPNGGYRFRFLPTNHVKPAGTYFLPDDQNQYRGYPGAVVGGKTETQRFVLSGSDSVVYNDISKEGQSPAYNRDAVAGLEKPRTTLMDGKDYIASVVAATSTAEARGEPTPTIPAPPSPSPRPGEIQPALSTTPESVLTISAVTAGTNISQTQNSSSRVSKVTPTTTTGNGSITTLAVTSASKGLTASLTPGSVTRGEVAQNVSTDTPAAQSVIPVTNSPKVTADSATNESISSNGNNLIVSILLAVFGIVSLVLFWKFRFRIYPIFGIEVRQPVRSKVIHNKKTGLQSRAKKEETKESGKKEGQGKNEI